MFCAPRFTYFYALKVAPLHYNLILCDSASFLCTFPVESVFITGSFHPAVYPSSHQPPAGTRGIFHGLSPAWTWNQRQPHAAVYVWLFHHLMGSKMNLAAPSRARGLFGLFPRHHVPHLAAGLSQSGCGCRVFLLTAGPPALRYPLCSHSPHVCLCPCHALSL